jgi:hypothetical protein
MYAKALSYQPSVQKNVKKANFLGIFMTLNNVNWSELFFNTDNNTVVERFYNVYMQSYISMCLFINYLILNFVVGLMVI